MITVSKPHHLPCGCRPRTVKSKGHRPQCLSFDLTRHQGRRKLAQFRRRWSEIGATHLHARGVMLAR